MTRRVFLHSLICLLYTAVLSILLPNQAWQIDIGTKQAQRYTTHLREAESAALPSADQTFQWALVGSSLLVPDPAQLRMLTVQTLQRSEDPPAAIHIRVGVHAISIPPTAGIRTVRLLLPASDKIGFDCDTQAVTNSALQPLCIALLSAKTQIVSPRIALDTILRVAVLCVVFASIATLTFRGSRTLSLIAALAVTSVSAAFPAVVSVSWQGLLTVSMGWLGALVLIHWKVRTPWLRIALIGVCAGAFLKAAGVLSPGYVGTDIGFHLHKYEAIVQGHIYQIADGQGLTYPYPPTIYVLLALIALPLEWVGSLPLVLHVSAVAVDATTVILLAWVANLHGWSLRRIGLVAALYVLLPAGYLLQWQATVAQTIGQWLGVIAVVTTVIESGPVRTVAMAAAMLGHFGAFLSLHLTYTLAFLDRTLRRQALHWWLVFLGVSVLYFSQYSSTIVAQLGSLRNTDAASSVAQRWWQYAWGYGLAGHYAGVFVVLCILGLLASRPSPLRSIAWCSAATTAFLLVAQVGFDIDVTRYVIYLFPVVALYGAVPLSSLWRSRAGTWTVIAVVAGVGVQSALAWYMGVTAGVRLGFLW